MASTVRIFRVPINEAAQGSIIIRILASDGNKLDGMLTYQGDFNYILKKSWSGETGSEWALPVVDGGEVVNLDDDMVAVDWNQDDEFAADFRVTVISANPFASSVRAEFSAYLLKENQAVEDLSAVDLLAEDNGRNPEVLRPSDPNASEYRSIRRTLVFQFS
ncbi:MAG: hypothetical protein KKB75_17005 [Alphaproteobacteria bacterium]|nr:hypothetical protein [Alphaproteobacteria bacterium]MBU2142003.1 hypothetical protein [Alphaproteobacteria bacterium]MBU2198385.1 hypothetical protein [Alphaproteobacteria bacterium]